MEKQDTDSTPVRRHVFFSGTYRSRPVAINLNVYENNKQICLLKDFYPLDKKQNVYINK